MLMTIDESSGVLKKAEGEYKGHRSLLMRTRSILSTMRRQDVIDRVILIFGFIVFSLAVLYIVSKHIGVLKLQRKVLEVVKAGMVKDRGAPNGLNIPQPIVGNAHEPVIRAEQALCDEL